MTDNNNHSTSRVHYNQETILIHLFVFIVATNQQLLSNTNFSIKKYLRSQTIEKLILLSICTCSDLFIHNEMKLNY